MNHPGLALHVLALGLALALAGTDAALHPPDPPRPTLAPRCSYQRLRLVGAPLPASHPRYGREVERREGWLDTPPGGQGPIPVTCWLREGRLIELTTRGSEAIRDSEAAAALGSERGALGELSPGAAIDLDWIWAELGLAHSLGGEVELALVACDFAPGFLSYDQVSSPPGRCAVVHALRDPEPERSAEPGVLLRLGVRLQLTHHEWFYAFSADGRRARLLRRGSLSLVPSHASAAPRRSAPAPPATAAGAAR